MGTEETGGLPSGVVTFVFTDIEGSTRMFRRLGEAFPPLLDRHNSLLRREWERHGGVEVKTDGDSFLVAFAEAGAAVSACADAQRALQAEPWPADGAVTVRMGVHAGLAYPRGNDYVALAVHQAARVVGAANGGQIVVSQQAAELADQIVGAAMSPVGRFRLRDFDEPVQLCVVAGEGLVTSGVALRVVPADGHNLVRPRTRLIGREDAVTGLAELSGPGRLVSIVGPGGVGKTRLVTELGLTVADTWADGVWFVDLSVISDPSSIDIAVADAVGCSVAGDTAVRDTLLGHLGKRAASMIIDNCEHLVDDVASLVDAILSRCDGVGVVTTSRTSLGRADELVWRLSPLATDGVAVVAAVELFVERAGAVRSGQVVTADDPAVADICRRLDGLPLAIELAAARVAVLTPAEIDAGLEDRFRLLRSRDRTTPQRQRTLEALLDWSYELLTEDERAALRRLGIFAASFDIETATAAVAADDIDAYDVAELVWSLADKSLVGVEPAANATRYRLLHSVRHYARRDLDRVDETLATACRLATWYLDRLGPECVLATQFEHSRASELENLKSLVDSLGPDDPAVGQALVVAIDRLHRFSAPYPVSIASLRDGLDRFPEPTHVRLDLLCRLAYLLGTRDEHDVVADVLVEATEVERVAGRPPWNPTILQAAFADYYITIGDYERAQATAEQAMKGGTTPRGSVALLNRIAIANTALGDLAAAATSFQLALQASLELGTFESLGFDYGNLAEIAYRQGDYVSAAEHQLAALKIGCQVDDRLTISFSMILAGRLAHRRGQLPRFVQLNAAGEAILDAIGTNLYEDDRQVTDHLLATTRAILSEVEFTAACSAGEALTLPDAIALTDQVLTAAAHAVNSDESVHSDR